jgi:hypothetical protein
MKGTNTECLAATSFWKSGNTDGIEVLEKKLIFFAAQ